MKTNKVQTLLAIFFFLHINLKAQDDPNCGRYVDGIKTDKIDCYTFGALHLVLPYNDTWKGYDKINIQIDFESEEAPIMGVQSFQKGTVGANLKGKYIVYTIFDKDWQAASKFNYANLIQLTKWKLAHRFKMGKSKPADDVPLIGRLFGLTIIGYEEKFDNSCNCLKKTEVTNSTKLSSAYFLNCTNRTTNNDGKIGALVDLSQPCSVTGTKVDFNNPGK